ncbi:MAG: hypothetical protein GY696_25165 [Gammaproteobacteria bacterium]|nr:hypothetical protein [Gammaproteobacteria bacterium]
MGLRNTVQIAVGLAFDNDLSDAVKTFTYKSVTGAAYNPANGGNTPTYSSVSSRGVFDRYSLDELHMAGITPEDIKVLILQNELSVTPDVDDIIVYNTIQYKVISRRRDPAEVAWELQCRA